MSKKIDKFLWIVLIIVFGLINAYMLFHNLGKGYLLQTDEAYHATNAYEMLKQGNWVVNTYRYATDYFNSKPPLALDLMVLSYKTFGVSGFAARFPSALSGFITCALIVAFLIYRKDLYSAAFFPGLICACSTLYTFHMYRAAEMDSVYDMFFAIAMLSLCMMSEKPDFMYLYGLALGLAFMCKGPHAALIFIIGLLYIPRIKGAFHSVKRVIISVLLAVIIPASWMIKRYMFDGTRLFEALFGGEVVDRVSSAGQLMFLPFLDFFTAHITMIFAVASAIAIVLLLIGKRTDGLNVRHEIAEFLRDNYLFILWALVPLMFFSLTRSFLTWYTYTSQIAMCVLTANLLSRSIRRFGGQRLIVQLTVSLVAVALSLFFIIPCILKDINPAGAGGHPVDQFTDEMQEFYGEWGKEYADVNAYLIPAFTVSGNAEGHWEPEYVAPAEMYCDLIPLDGTLEDFLNDDGAILILDKSLWDEYASVLTGHVILHDNSYLVFSNKMYGE